MAIPKKLQRQEITNSLAITKQETDKEWSHRLIQYATKLKNSPDKIDLYSLLDLKINSSPADVFAQFSIIKKDLAERSQDKLSDSTKQISVILNLILEEFVKLEELNKSIINNDSYPQSLKTQVASIYKSVEKSPSIKTAQINGLIAEFNHLQKLLKDVENHPSYPQTLKNMVSNINAKDGDTKQKIDRIEQLVADYNQLQQLITSISNNPNYSDELKEQVRIINQGADSSATKIQDIKSECDKEEQEVMQATKAICDQLATQFPEIAANSYPNANSISDFSSACTAKEQLKTFFGTQQQRFSTEPYQSNPEFQAQLTTFHINPPFNSGLDLLQTAKAIETKMMLDFIEQNFKYAPNGERPKDSSDYQMIKKYYDGTLAGKTKADNQTIKDLTQRLQTYIDRIKSHKKEGSEEIDFSHGFWFNKKSRALNREMNYYIALTLLNNLQATSPDLNTFKQIETYKGKILKSFPSFKKSASKNPISSTELQEIVEAGKLLKK